MSKWEWKLGESILDGGNRRQGQRGGKGHRVSPKLKKTRGMVGIEGSEAGNVDTDQATRTWNARKEFHV